MGNTVMGNNTSRSTSWSEEPELRKALDPCGDIQPEWPHKVCTFPRTHEGDHCNEAFAGTKWIMTWWKRKV
jgi:hypothetical protein